MELRVIATGSAGNAYLLDAGDDQLILDCGVAPELLKRACNYNMSHVRGCLVTHEHNDHVKAAAALMQQGIDVYTSKGTAQAANLSGHRLHLIASGDQTQIGMFVVKVFDVKHDANEPLGFIIQYLPTNERVLYMTDTGYCRYVFSGIHYFVVECNYCADILRNRLETGEIGRRHRQRLAESHMSLERLLEFFAVNATSTTRAIILVHLSDENSDEARMIQEIYDRAGVDTVAARAGMDISLNMCPF